MKAKWVTLLVAVLVLTPIAGYPPAKAAPPAGEVKTVAANFGNGVPVPSLESAAADDWIQLLYDSLVGYTPEGKFSPDLGLVNKWEMSPDALTYTFYIRRGVKFHDGIELTAKDAKFSIEQIMLPGAAPGESYFLRQNVKSIDVKDPYTLVITCKQPYIFLADILSNLEGTGGMVVPKDYYERVGRDVFVKNPIGSGPYKFHSLQDGAFIKLEATDKHWRDGVPRFKYMTYQIIPEESTQLAMLRTGQADIARISRDAVKEALGAGLNIVNKEDAAVVVLHPNMQWTSPAFSDIRFRKALNLAIDKEAIIKNLFAGMAKPLAGYPGSNIAIVGGDLTLKPYPYDSKEAARLIKEGGWEGHEFTLISYDRPRCPEFTKVVETVAGYWEKIGLKPKIRMSDWAVFRRAWNERKTQNMVHGYDDGQIPSVPLLLVKFMEKWYFPHQSGRSTVNLPELNQRFERIEKSKDIAEGKKLMAEIYRYAYDQYLMIPICEFSEKIATTKRVPPWDPGRRNDRNYYDLIKQR